MSTFSNIGSRLVDGDLLFYSKTTGATIATFGAAGATLTIATGGLTVADLAFGSAEAVAIAVGVATVTGSFVELTSETGTTDQLDTITKADAAAGDLLLLVPVATDTITVDDANINLGGIGSRAIAPGGSLLLYYDGTEWTELFFTASTDNA
jgi:hypothetical protein